MALTGSGRGLDASYPALAPQVPIIRRAVTGAASGWGADEETLTRISLAVTEAATNVVVHAYRPARPSSRIYVRARREGEFFAVTIGDAGVGMSPRADSPGLRLGLSLMAHEAEQCEIHARAGGGTEVRLRFALPEAARESWTQNGHDAAGAAAGAIA